MAAGAATTIFGFVVVDVTIFGRSKSIHCSNLVDMTQLTAEIASVCEKQTAAILEFDFRYSA